MAAALACAAVMASLSVSPDRSQYFQMERFTVSCPADSWAVFRSTLFVPSPKSCAKPWGAPNGPSCVVGPLRHTDSGRYWCQSEDKCSPEVNVTIQKKGAVLESPLFPVRVGERATLRCSFKETDLDKPTSNFNASFFRSDTFLGPFSGGKMELSVSQKDEGLYRCEHPTKARSTASRLIVKLNDAPLLPSAPPSLVPPSSSPHPMGIPLDRLVSFLVLFLLYTLILCISISIYCRWSRARAEQKQQECEHISLRRIRDA